MREWQIGDPVDGTTDGWMDAQNWGHGREDEKDEGTPSRNRSSNPKRDEYSNRAWDLYQDFKEEEALRYINMALDLDSKNANNWNRKAIILEALERYSESEECYIKSNELEYSYIVCDNLARMLYRWASRLIEDAKKSHDPLRILEDAKSICTRAMQSLPGDKSEENIEKYLKLYDTVNFYMEYENKYLKNIETVRKYPKEELFTITGRNFQKHVPLHQGMSLKLVREPDNEFDSDAIAVYAGDEKVGYVANSPHTKFEMTSTASELKDSFSDRAEYLCYLERYTQVQFPIGRIIR